MAGVVGGLLLLLGLLALVAGCTQRPELRWEPVGAELLHPPGLERYAGHDAVVLYESYSLVTGYDDAFIVEQRHRVVRVQTERGRSVVTLRAPADAVEFVGRIIAPDGRERWLDTEALEALQHTDLEVGSVIETSVTTLTEGRYQAFHDETIGADGPVLRYRAEIVGGDGLEGTARLFNLAGEFERVALGEGWRLSLALTDVAPVEAAQSLAPHDSQRVPFFVYVTERTSDREEHASWASTLSRLGTRLYRDREWQAGYDAELLVEGCAPGDVRCRLELALREVDARLAISSLGGVWPSKGALVEATEAGRGDSFDKAALLVHLLESAGVEARFAFGTRRLGRRFERDFPNDDWLDHTLVYLPEQPGLEAPLWVAPSCEHCAPGVLPRWLDGMDAVVLRREGKRLEASVERPSGELDAVAQALSTREAELGSEGVLRVDEHLVFTGELATLERLWEAQGSEGMRTQRQREISAAALERPADQPPCDAEQGRCELTMRYALANRLSAVGGRRFTLPLSALLGTDWDGALEPESRRDDLVLPRDEVFEEVVRVRLAPGFELRELPAPYELATDGARASLSVEHTGERELVLRRRLELRAGRYPVAQYAALREVLQGATAAHTQVIAVELDGAERERSRLLAALVHRERGALYTCLAAAGQAAEDALVPLRWGFDETGGLRSVALADDRASDPWLGQCLLEAASGWGTALGDGPSELELGLRVANGAASVAADGCGAPCRLLAASLPADAGPLRAALYARACDGGDAASCTGAALLEGDAAQRAARLRQGCTGGDALACHFEASAEAVEPGDVDRLVLEHLIPRLGACERADAAWRRVEARWSVVDGASRDVVLPDDVDETAASCVRAAIEATPWPQATTPHEVARRFRLRL